MVISHKIKWKQLIIALAIPLLVGALSAIFTGSNMELYKNLNRPPLSPPGSLFPVVWTVLYILMGIAAYLVYISGSADTKTALTLYYVQLAANFIWTLIFFNLQSYLFSFIWLIGLLFLIILTMIAFYKINKTSALLLLPYALWVTFAGYLNLGIYILNR